MNTAINEKVSDVIGWKGVLDFSGDISAAWHVVKKIIETGAEISIYYDHAKECWTCDISSEKDCSAFIEDGETESMAICIAAIRLFSALNEKE